MKALVTTVACMVVLVAPAAADTTSVRPTDILAPVGAVDSGVTLTPVAVVRNLGDQVADSVHVTFEVRDFYRVVIYHDETRVLNLGAGESDTLSFSSWVPTARDSLEAVTWTYWAGDSVPEDDTLSARFVVRVHDIGITGVMAPPRLPDSGVWYRPSCRVCNLGTQAETFDVVFDIGSYHSVFTVSNLPPNFTRVATAPDSWLALPGIWVYRITLEPLSGPPLSPWVDTIHVRGAGAHDVAIEQVLAPVGTLDTTTVIRPAVRVANYGGAGESLAVTMSIHAPGDTLVYDDSMWFYLPGGGQMAVSLDSVRFRTLGEHAGACSLFIRGVPEFRFIVDWTFLVVSGLGLAEGNAGPLPRGAATVVRGVLNVPRDMTDFRSGKPDRVPRPRAVLLDISGRRVMALAPGANDVSDLSPGVYFIRAEGSMGRESEGSSRKVVIQR